MHNHVNGVPGITRYTSLRSIEITAKHTELDLVARALSHVRSKAFEEALINVVVVTDWGNLEHESQKVLEQMQDACNRIDCILAAQLAFPSLRLARWTILHEHPEETVFGEGFREALETRLPRCQQRGILAVSVRYRTSFSILCLLDTFSC